MDKYIICVPPLLDEPDRVTYFWGELEDGPVTTSNVDAACEFDSRDDAEKYAEVMSDDLGRVDDFRCYVVASDDNPE